MVVTKPAELRREQKKYFSIAYSGEPVVVSRPRNENVVVISEEQYRELTTGNGLLAYYSEIVKNEDFDVSFAEEKESERSPKRIIGIAKDINLCNPEYDFEEFNDEIAKMFGVV